MRLRFWLLAALALPAPALAQVEKPAALVADGIPEIPASLADTTRPYMEFRAAGFEGWNPRTRGIVITTRFGKSIKVKIADNGRLAIDVDTPFSHQVAERLLLARAG